MKEIGSEFWDVPVIEKSRPLFPDTVQWFLSGRSALQAILRELKGAGSAALPSWCCDSMIRPFVDAGLDVRFYPVYFRRGLVQELRTDCDVLLLMDYFGYTPPKPELSGFGGIVIRDLTHSLFSASCTDADYYFGSLRKWAGFWTGGYAWTRDGRALPVANEGDQGYTALRRTAMELKNSYIGQTPLSDGTVVRDKAYLQVFGQAEDRLETARIAPADPRDIRLACRLDEASIRTRRRANARILMDALKPWLIFPELKDTDCPMFVPVLVPDGQRDALRRFLIGRDIYCPVHWPVSALHRLDERERFLYDHELSLVCDQRYSSGDMDRLADTVRQFRKER